METSLESTPLFLGIETSGKSGGLAFYKGQLLTEINFLAAKSYSQSLFNFLPFFLERGGYTFEEIQYIAVDIGPGSFTGLRIGISAIKALTLIYNYPIVPITSLEILAYNFSNSSYPILSIVDAYTKELFLALYKFEGDKMQTLYPPSLLKLNEIKYVIKEPTLFVSETLDKWEEYLKEELGDYFIKPLLKPTLRASLLCEIAWQKLMRREVELLSGEELLPLYLKASEAERKGCYHTS